MSTQIQTRKGYPEKSRQTIKLDSQTISKEKSPFNVSSKRLTGKVFFWQKKGDYSSNISLLEIEFDRIVT